ncbi:MAG: ROK family protein [Anaerolineaceae bacterium]|nr:ROK family protein [Anaerolineaceae bacterium]
MEKATRQHTKEHNRNLVLKNIFQHESISRADIARITRLTATTVSDIVADLIEEGLVSEIGVGRSIGGKNPILLNLVEDARWLISLDLAHNQFRGAVVNLRGNIQQLTILPVNDRTGDDALALVYKILDELIQGASQPVLGIGVGAPGLINTSEGLIVHSVNLNWVNLPLTSLLKKRYHLPVYVLNDSQAAAIGEYTYSKNHQADEDMIVINVRHGIGAGIVINGILFQGDGGSAGEIGHLVVVPDGGELCRCGKKGCLETVASAQALIKRVRTLLSQYPNSLLAIDPQQISLETIEKAFGNNDPLACQAVLETAHYIGIAISSLVGILNIQKIILAGDMTRFGEPWLDEIKKTMMSTSLAEAAQNTRVEIGQFSENGIILGASAIMANNYSLLFNH